MKYLMSENLDNDCLCAYVAGEGCEDYRPKEEKQCQKEVVLNGDGAATTKSNVAPLKVETSTIQQDASVSSAPDFHADAGVATQSLSAAEPASLAADEYTKKPTFSNVATAVVDQTVE